MLRAHQFLISIFMMISLLQGAHAITSTFIIDGQDMKEWCKSHPSKCTKNTKSIKIKALPDFEQIFSKSDSNSSEMEAKEADEEDEAKEDENDIEEISKPPQNACTTCSQHIYQLFKNDISNRANQLCNPRSGMNNSRRITIIKQNFMNKTQDLIKKLDEHQCSQLEKFFIRQMLKFATKSALDENEDRCKEILKLSVDVLNDHRKNNIESDQETMGSGVSSAQK